MLLRIKNKKTVALGAVAALAAICLQSCGPVYAASPNKESRQYGIEFDCRKSTQVDDSMYQALTWLSEQGIQQGWVTLSTDLTPSGAKVMLGVKPELALASTLEIAKSSFFNVGADLVSVLDPRHEEKLMPAVSKKEILLALMHPGRKSVYGGADCGLSQLQDEVGVRQHIVAFAQSATFGWPDGEPAKWNNDFWDRGTPLGSVDMAEALANVFMEPSKYEIGCYTAAKLAITAATVDYYKRVKHSPEQLAQVYEALMRDGDPLVNIEPGDAWSFIPSYNEADSAHIDGKLLRKHEQVGAYNFVPGDWIYLVNLDSKTGEKTGYEGSNALYLGMDRFSDYYNDHEKAYNYKQKMHEVYQWRHEVFSRTRDAAKVVPLTEADFNKLAKSPENGGIQLPWRLVPKTFELTK
ncbi:hypothetical protein [Comamonas thiooxydans]|uniref:hypothetical protein n=1 Tax=Comamonas thiooxydans TaxID=363952 RepID=UPI000B407908|nr:hypothetical protein [Comamonas thiooxydans]